MLQNKRALRLQAINQNTTQGIQSLVLQFMQMDGSDWNQVIDTKQTKEVKWKEISPPTRLFELKGNIISGSNHVKFKQVITQLVSNMK